jgi:hypothetical protein
MRESIMSPSNHPAALGRFTVGQIAQRTTWRRVPDVQSALAAMHVIHVVPQNGSTVTELNPLDPGTVSDGGWDADGMAPGWLDRPHAQGSNFRRFR